MKLLIVSCLLLGVAFADNAANFQDCFQKDSISCVQLVAYRKAKAFFDQDTISLVGGLSFAKSNDRAGKSLVEDNSAAIESATTLETREDALESYVVGQAKNFFEERALKWDIATGARSLANAIPEDIKANVRALVVESRGKKKKLIKKLLPLLGILKLKFAVFGVIAFFVVAAIAKKALLLSVISLALSGAGLFRKLLGGLGGGSGGGSGGDSTSYSSGGWSSGGGGGGNGGWSSGGGGGGGHDSHGDSYGSYGSYSSPVAHSIAYQGHKAARR